MSSTQEKATPYIDATGDDSKALKVEKSSEADRHSVGPEADAQKTYLHGKEATKVAEASKRGSQDGDEVIEQKKPKSFYARFRPYILLGILLLFTG
jgi:hypothetical protein